MPVERAQPSDVRERRLLLSTVGRLAVATLLLSGTLYVAIVSTPTLWSFTPSFIAALIASTYTATLASAVWLRRARNPQLVARAQAAVDILLTTGMVYITGGASSGFTFLYGISVLMAALVAGAPVARIAGTSSIALYVALSIGMSLRWIGAPPDQTVEAYSPSARELIFATTTNVLGLTLVTVLSSNLAARLQAAGGLLRAAEENVAELARLNDDIVRSLTSGLITTDLQGALRTINPIGAQMLKVDAADVVHTDVVALLRLPEALRDLHRAGEVKRHEVIAQRHNGETFPMGYSVTPLVSAEGAENGWIVVFQDLTEIAQLRHAAERAERLAVLGRLSAGLAHEIRNPLSSIAGSVELVRESPRIDQEERHLLGIVLTESERLNELVSTMLQVSKPSAPRRANTDLSQVVREVVAIAQGSADRAQVTIRHRAHQSVIAAVDVDQFRQILWNLLKNAMQASPHGSSIEIVVSETVDTATLSVTDEGAGIDPVQRERIFEMFYSERTHGAGIGLALVRQLVDAHHGTIRAESKQGAGATFVVELPKRTSVPPHT